MAKVYRKYHEQARTEYWLNQDRIPMGTEERLIRHTACVQLTLADELKTLTDILLLPSLEEVLQTTDLVAIAEKVLNDKAR